MRLWLDLETRSDVNLSQTGVHVYAESAQIMLNSWAVDDGPVIVDEKPTPRFWDAFVKADEIWAHNAEFDRTVLHATHPGIDIRFDRWRCTMAQARRHGLPGGLDKLCQILGVPEDKAKMKDSRALLLMFCKPNKEGGFNDKQSHPTGWARFLTYGGLDISAMREVHRRCPRWNEDYETPIWLVDQKINARGFQVDTRFALAAVGALKECAHEVDSNMRQSSHGAVDSGRQVEALLEHILSEYGVDLPDLQAATIERRVADTDLPDEVRTLLALRQQSAKTSTSKYATVLRCTSKDGRLRGSMTYSGAMRTQRWAGNRFQPHNLPRPKIGQLRGKVLVEEIKRAIEAVTWGVYDLCATYPLPEVLASAVRGVVVPARGKKLTVGDYSNVEGRGLAWLAGEEWKLQAFRDFDEGIGSDLYKLAYAEAFGVDPEDVDDGLERQIGKVMELMLGYGGGVGAFITGAATYKINLSELVKTAWPNIPERVKAETERMWEWSVLKKMTYGLDELTFRTCDGLKRLWREKHPAVVQFWADVEDCFINATRGIPSTLRLLKFDKVGNWVRIQLPSGRYLSYPGARCDDKGKLSYMGQNQYTRTWSRIGTCGGKLAENITQAVCRDLLAESMLNCEEWGLPVVLHVHDELVVENPEDQTDNLVDAMRTVDWADGLPLAVAAHVTDRYAKE